MCARSSTGCVGGWVLTRGVGSAIGQGLPGQRSARASARGRKGSFSPRYARCIASARTYVRCCTYMIVLCCTVPQAPLYSAYLGALCKFFFFSSAIHQLVFCAMSTLPFAIGQVCVLCTPPMGTYLHLCMHSLHVLQSSACSTQCIQCTCAFHGQQAHPARMRHVMCEPRLKSTLPASHIAMRQSAAGPRRAQGPPVPLAT